MGSLECLLCRSDLSVGRWCVCTVGYARRNEADFDAALYMPAEGNLATCPARRPLCRSARKGRNSIECVKDTTESCAVFSQFGTGVHPRFRHCRVHSVLCNPLGSAGGALFSNGCVCLLFAMPFWMWCLLVQVLDLLSKIWTIFDDFCGELNLYKVSTRCRDSLSLLIVLASTRQGLV